MAIVSATELSFTLQNEPSWTCGKIPMLEPIGRIKDINRERIQRVVECTITRVEECFALFSIVEDDKKIFTLKDIELRELILKHQFIIKDFKIGESLPVDLCNSFKDILRYTEAHNLKLTSFASIESELSSSSLYLHLTELKQIMQHKLLTEKDEVDRQNMLQLKTLEKARESRVAISYFTKVLNQKTKLKVKELERKERFIQEMRNDINLIKLSSDDRNKKILNDSAKQITTDLMSSRAQAGRIKQDIIDLQNAEKQKIKPNVSAEQLLRKRNNKLEVELMNWIEKYDEGMGQLQHELEGLLSEHNKEKQKLKETEIHFKETKKEYDVIIENRRLEKEEMERLAEESKKLNKCAQIIQALWRGYFQRKKLAQGKNKKDKKGKKGKKGKK